MPSLQKETNDSSNDAIDDLRSLTDGFRNSLPVFRDSNGNTKLVNYNGDLVKLVFCTQQNLQKYAQAYTDIWIEQSEMMKTEMKNHWFIDCRSIYIKGHPYYQSENSWAPTRFDDSIFEDDLIMDNQEFLGFFSCRSTKFSQDVAFLQCKFHSRVDFDFSSFPHNLDFSNSQFMGPISFQRLEALKGEVNFSNTIFHRAPVFHETKLPQGTSFEGAQFPISHLGQSDLIKDALAFRTLKQAAAGYRGQLDEADFFALEQKSRRLAFLAPHVVWFDHWRDPKSGLGELFNIDSYKYFKKWRLRFQLVEWIISLLYDWISSYGRNPGKALNIFLLLNLATTAFYRYFYFFGDCSSKTAAYCTPNSSEVTFANANPAIQLTIQNLLNPAGLTTDKVAVAIHDSSMIAISIFQFSSSYLIIFLAALAIKTRFQKGGGGDR